MSLVVTCRPAASIARARRPSPAHASQIGPGGKPGRADRVKARIKQAGVGCQSIPVRAHVWAQGYLIADDRRILRPASLSVYWQQVLFIAASFPDEVIAP